MRCLVTGGAGFIGSHVVDLLIEEGHEVIVIDDLSYGSRSNLNSQAEFYAVKMSDPIVREKFKGVDWVFHLAAIARIQRSIDMPMRTHDTNVTSTLGMLELARRNKVKKFVYSSSSSVYGNQPTHVMTEDMKPRPLSPYALHKYMSEQYCALYSRLFGLKTVSLRYFNVYGHRQVEKGAYALVIAKFMRLMRNNEPVTIYGDGNQTRDYTWVQDVARANLLAAEANFEKFEAINIGTGTETSVNEIASKLGANEIEFIIPNPRGEFEEMRKCASNQKAKTKLGWQPTVSLIEGLEQLNEN